MSPRYPPVEQRLWNKVDKDGPYAPGRLGKCWEWTGAGTGDGYGRIKVEGRLHLPHRLVYEWEHGPIPPGWMVDHVCHNRGCVRPTHLEAVEGRVNTIRGVSHRPDNVQERSAKRAGFL